MDAAFNVSFEVFQKAFIDSRKLQAQIERRERIALERIGAIAMRQARKSIKRRRVTSKQWDRLQAAQEQARLQPTAQHKARVKRIAETIRRKRDDSAPAGAPPYQHGQDHPVASIRAIYFARQGNTSVLVGPVKADGKLRGSDRSTVPELLEQGGTQTLREVSYDGGTTWFLASTRRALSSRAKIRTRRARYKKHPTMQLALRAIAPQAAAILANV